jgi:hypothetical protein
MKNVLILHSSYTHPTISQALKKPYYYYCIDNQYYILYAFPDLDGVGCVGWCRMQKTTFQKKTFFSKTAFIKLKT